jgi:glyoxylase-like metal-dependent hydrolase (beta-lactamase superfamily II)
VLPGPGEPIEQRLTEVGVDIDQVHTVAVSHLHHDHAGGLKLFAGKVPVHAQFDAADLRRRLDSGELVLPEGALALGQFGQQALQGTTS